MWHLKIRLTGGPTVFFFLRGRTVTVPVDESGISVRILPERGGCSYVMPSHQYPTGVVMPIGRRMEL
ncbi:MAG: hypothetical protein ACLUOI_04875 [Eisenbergiella sp.]